MALLPVPEVIETVNGCDPAWLDEMRNILWAGIVACLFALVTVNREWSRPTDDE